MAALSMMATMTAGATEEGMWMIAIVLLPISHVIAFILPSIAPMRAPAPLTMTTTGANQCVRRLAPQKKRATADIR